MKKLLAIMMAVTMILSLSSCGKKPGKTDNPGTSSGSGEIKTALFTLNYDGAVWKNIEDEFSNEEDYCSANLQILDPEDNEYYLIDAEVEVSIEDPYDFREDLVYYGFNQNEYKVNKAYETVNIGGLDLLKYDDEDDTLVYFNRIEGAGASVYVKFDAQSTGDSRIADFVKGLNFTLADTGNVDGPWEWEGTRFTTDDHTVNAGGITLTSKFIPFEQHISTFETFNHAIAAVGDKIYVLANGELSECQNDGAALAFIKGIELPEDDYESICSTADGSLWLSGSMNDVIRIKDGAAINTYEDLYNVAIHPSGAWGVDYFTSNECKIVTFAGDSYTATPIVFNEVDSIMYVNVDENNIYVCGSAKDESGHKVFVYNKAGALQKTLCDAEGEGLGSITFITQTANGFIGFDGNMRDVLLWNADGSFKAEISGDELFGTDYPWFCASTLLNDGSIMTIMTEEREDRSATEVIVFNVKGF